MNGRNRKIDFEEDELNKLKIGECIEKEIDGEKIIVCGKKIDREEDYQR